MRIVDRHDGLLLAGLALAVFIVFQRGIQFLLDVARDVDVRYGVALLPALVVLTGIFVFHQTLKRQEVNARAAAAAVEAAQAHARARDLERLVAFGDALARALTFESLREVVCRHLPRIAGDREAWLFVRNADGWQEVIGASCSARDEALAELSDEAFAENNSTIREIAGTLCFPLRFGDRVVGALGIADVAPDAAERQFIAASVALLAIAVRNAQLFAETQDSATRDRLTGCYNRRQMIELLDGELRRAARGHSHVSVVMFDIDHFKDINDAHGHAAGDAVLAAVGRRLAETLRQSDHRCRYGGDEFVIILPDTPAQAAVLVAEATRREIADLGVMTRGRPLPVSASIGVACADTGDTNPAAILERADGALYRAKQSGRNCVRVDEESREEPRRGSLDELPAVGTLAS